MDFEWDEVKSEACFSGRGFDFAYVARAFYDPDRQLMGKIERRVFVVVYTPRHGAIRIISARKANQREVKRYENSARED